MSKKNNGVTPRKRDYSKFLKKSIPYLFMFIMVAVMFAMFESGHDKGLLYGALFAAQYEEGCLDIGGVFIDDVCYKYVSDNVISCLQVNDKLVMGTKEHALIGQLAGWVLTDEWFEQVRCIELD